MVILKSPIPDIEIPALDVYRYVLETESSKDDKAVFIDAASDQRVTIGEVKRDSKRLAAGLQDSLGLKRGDVVAVFSPNQFDYAIVIFGIVAAGGIVTFANPLYAVRELTGQLLDSGATILIAHPLFLKVALESATAANIPSSKIYLFGGQEVDGIKPYTDLLGEREALPVTYGPQELDETVYICYSSGTTGKQKGACLSHRNIVSNAAQILTIESDYYSSDKVFIGVLPFFHIYALNMLVHCVLRIGASTIVHSRFDLRNFCESIQNYKINILHVVPPIVLALIKEPLAREYDFSSAELLFSGAAPLSQQLTDDAQQIYGFKIKQGYGLTEASPATHIVPTNNIVSGSIGVLLPNMEAKLVTDDGQELERGPGELWVRGPNVFKGYLNNKEATEETIDADGFLHTGDVLIMDENGYYFIIDRSKELIKYKGFQVAPAELEAVLLSLDHDEYGIADAAVIGIWDDTQSTELPLAYISLQKDRQPNEDLKKKIQDAIANTLAPFKRLRGGIIFTDRIPKSPSGKILRRLLRERVKEDLIGMNK